MSRNSIGSKVARAAATGSRRRTTGSQRPVGWYGSLTLVVVLGVSVVGYSRYELSHPASAVQPTVGTHWQAAIGFDICGKPQPNLPRPSDANSHGITTSGNGLIQIAPKTASEAGVNATLGRFVSGYHGLVINSNTLALPGKSVHHAGQHCGSKTAGITVETWSSLAASSGTIYNGNPADLKLQDGEIIAVGFVAKGRSLPEPSSRFALVGGALGPQTSKTPTTLAPSSSTSTPAGSSSSTGIKSSPGAAGSTKGAGSPTTSVASNTPGPKTG